MYKHIYIYACFEAIEPWPSFQEETSLKTQAMWRILGCISPEQWAHCKGHIEIQSWHGSSEVATQNDDFRRRENGQLHREQFEVCLALHFYITSFTSYTSTSFTRCIEGWSKIQHLPQNHWFFSSQDTSWLSSLDHSWMASGITIASQLPLIKACILASMPGSANREA